MGVTMGVMDDVRTHNRMAWDREVDKGNPWTIPVTSDVIARARNGDWSLLLTPEKPVPREWYPTLRGADVLCLASGGGQQAPVLAAVGAKVTLLDNSPKQLDRDRVVAEREGLSIRLVEGDMRDFPELDEASFDLIFHPVSNCFVDSVLPVWKECARVLRPGGVLLAGFSNPVRYLFDDELLDQGTLRIRHTIPYADSKNIDDAYTQSLLAQGDVMEFGHTLEDQLDGQLRAGLVLSGLFEDRCPAHVGDPISAYINSFISTRAYKPL